MPTLAYIAAPYGAPTAHERAENTRRAGALATLAAAWGCAPICVHPLIEAGVFGDDGNPADRARGLACCMAQVEAVAKAGGEMWILLRDDGQRVIGRTATTEMLTGIKGGGGLEKYLDVEVLRPYINLDSVLERMVDFRLPEVDGLNRRARGLPADLLVDLCAGFVSALEAPAPPHGDRGKVLLG